MPDANGNFKGIAVPALPWHEDQTANPKTEPAPEGVEEGSEE